MLRAQWTSITPQQEAYFGKFRERKNRIGTPHFLCFCSCSLFVLALCFVRGLINPTDKDVWRTDRTQELFQADNSPMSALLRDLLITYSFYDFDIGPCP